ncbi:hypothetical protein M885DRAFT_506223 [Pelagophyceae sp. CCMP2097]|nr:hypothetical protein M885DRAFT_506223 [Pelagophyceae sp. CCMP2097]|mmetsp:Transcript_23160/g.78268  ORF Transcript_23160/g.78268 Transcript_23160/m.78268 type:complete len:181 (+) Transcript_23160:387-929(+)
MGDAVVEPPPVSDAVVEPPPVSDAFVEPPPLEGAGAVLFAEVLETTRIYIASNYEAFGRSELTFRTLKTAIAETHGIRYGDLDIQTSLGSALDDAVEEITHRCDAGKRRVGCVFGHVDEAQTLGERLASRWALVAVACALVLAFAWLSKKRRASNRAAAASGTAAKHRRAEPGARRKKDH